MGQFILRLSTPAGQLFGTREFAADILVSFLQAEGYMRTDILGFGRCEYRGPYQQSGKLLSFSGTFTCETGDARQGTFEMRDVEVTESGFTAQLRTISPNVTQNGRVGAVRR